MGRAGARPGVGMRVAAAGGVGMRVAAAGGVGASPAERDRAVHGAPLGAMGTPRSEMELALVQQARKTPHMYTGYVCMGEWVFRRVLAHGVNNAGLILILKCRFRGSNFN